MFQTLNISNFLRFPLKCFLSHSFTHYPFRNYLGIPTVVTQYPTTPEFSVPERHQQSEMRSAVSLSSIWAQWFTEALISEYLDGWTLGNIVKIPRNSGVLSQSKVFKVNLYPYILELPMGGLWPMPEMPSRHLCYCRMQHPWHLLRDTNLVKQPHLLWPQLQICSFSSQMAVFQILLFCFPLWFSIQICLKKLAISMVG